ncbi:MAG: hypothetical protein P4L57_10630 [Rhizomicrobium sp.]|nr:hypothetical protein [Rhizomicrobium sp.]
MENTLADILADQNNADHEKTDSDTATPSSLINGEIEVASDGHPKPTDGGGKPANGETPPTSKTLRKEIRWFDWVNAGVAVATLIVAFAAYRVASDTRDIKSAVANLSTLASQSARQAKAAEGQLNEIRSEQRPWVAIPSADTGLMLAITEPLTFSKSGGAMRTAITLRNSGKKPAFGVRWNSKIVPFAVTREHELGGDLAAYCDPIRKQAAGILERTLFPDDRYVENFPSAVYPVDILRAFAMSNKLVNFPGKLEFAWIGCVDYRDADGSHHQSRYAFLLGAPIKNSGMWMGFIKPEGGHPEVRLIEALQSAD